MKTNLDKWNYYYDFVKNKEKKFVDKKTNKYCSGRCGVHDQMAHEG